MIVGNQVPVCGACGAAGPSADWPTTAKRGRRYYKNRCRSCRNLESAARARRRLATRSPRERLDKHLRYTYGITVDERDAMLERQGGGCAACGSTDPRNPKGWCVDHDHTCCAGGRKTCGQCVRGVLCFPCNAALGAIRDDQEALVGLLTYLKNPLR